MYTCLNMLCWFDLCIPPPWMCLQGNKGGVGIHFNVFHSSFCFINTHFSAHMEEVDKRNGVCTCTRTRDCWRPFTRYIITSHLFRSLRFWWTSYSLPLLNTPMTFLNMSKPCMHDITSMCNTNSNVPYSGKLLREKTFTNFAVLEPPTKVFSANRACHTHLW